jgi:hypothetical protein
MDCDWEGFWGQFFTIASRSDVFVHHQIVDIVAQCFQMAVLLNYFPPPMRMGGARLEPTASAVNYILSETTSLLV